MVRLVFCSSGPCSENLCLGCVGRNWNFHDDVLSEVVPIENSFQLYRELNLRVADFLNDRHYFERQVYAFVDSVAHQLEEAIWRNKSDRPISVKFSQFDTLMELSIFDINSSFLGLIICFLILLDQKFVIKSELTLRHS